MEEDQFFENIQRALENIPDNFNVLEEQIDIDVQFEYFEYARKLKRKDADYYLGKIESLFSSEFTIDEKKEILCGLASLPEVVSFRAIEKYNQEPDEDLKKWAVLALQESRMILKSSLLDEQQVFISTGLGGKGQKIRYFSVFINAVKDSKLTKLQQKVLSNELTDLLKKEDGELEEISFLKGYTIAMVVLPLAALLKDIFENVIEESNQYGNFLSEDVLITNVKKLSKKEIVNILKDKKNFDQLPDEEFN